MKVNLSRSASFAVVFIVYVLAGLSGILTFNALTFDLWLNLLIADIVATIVTFAFSLIFS